MKAMSFGDIDTTTSDWIINTKYVSYASKLPSVISQIIVLYTSIDINDSYLCNNNIKHTKIRDLKGRCIIRRKEALIVLIKHLFTSSELPVLNDCLKTKTICICSHTRSIIMLNYFLRDDLFNILKNKSLFRLYNSADYTPSQNKLYHTISIYVKIPTAILIDAFYSHYNHRQDAFYENNFTYHDVETLKNISIEYPLMLEVVFQNTYRIQIIVPYHFVKTHFVVPHEMFNLITSNCNIIQLTEFKY